MVALKLDRQLAADSSHSGERGLTGGIDPKAAVRRARHRPPV